VGGLKGNEGVLPVALRERDNHQRNGEKKEDNSKRGKQSQGGGNVGGDSIMERDQGAQFLEPSEGTSQKGAGRTLKRIS